MAVCQEEAKANVQRPWPWASDTADRPLRPGEKGPTNARRIMNLLFGVRLGGADHRQRVEVDSPAVPRFHLHIV